jgi:hypothetical protein
MVNREYGEIMRFLLYFRERFDSEEAYRGFVLSLLRELVMDLRDLDVHISLQTECLRPRVRRTEDVVSAETAKRMKAAPITSARGG